MRPAFRLTYDVFGYCLSFFTERDLLLLFNTLKNAKSDAIQAWVYGIERFIFAYNPAISHEAVSEVALYRIAHQTRLEEVIDIPRVFDLSKNIYLLQYSNDVKKIVSHIRSTYRKSYCARRYFLIRDTLCRLSKETLKAICVQNIDDYGYFSDLDKIMFSVETLLTAYVPFTIRQNELKGALYYGKQNIAQKKGSFSTLFHLEMSHVDRISNFYQCLEAIGESSAQDFLSTCDKNFLIKL